MIDDPHNGGSAPGQWAEALLHSPNLRVIEHGAPIGKPEADFAETEVKFGKREGR